MHIDKTKNHFHLDIKYIDQIAPGVPGQFVYLDNHGDYKLAISISYDDATYDTNAIKSNVQGVIWSIIGDVGFFIKTSYGSLKYREPLGPEYFNKNSNEIVIENEPNINMLPGKLGDKLWLSTTVPGNVQLEESNILLGYKTSYGMLYRPEYIFCVRHPCGLPPPPPSSSSSSS